jgi:hypothetical protein
MSGIMELYFVDNQSILYSIHNVITKKYKHLSPQSAHYFISMI